jgi:hypothetical protein
MADEPSFFEILNGHPDPRAQHRLTYLRLINAKWSEPWKFVVETMAGNVADAISDETKHVLRRELRERCERIAKAAAIVVREMTKSHGEQELIDAFDIFAPLGAKSLDDASGLQYIAGLRDRAEKVAQGIGGGSGKHTARTTLGQPSSRRLCAAMTREAFRHTRGEPPGDTYPPALEACASLWQAAGGSQPDEDASVDPVGSWERHLREARRGKDKASVAARRAARSCLGLLAELRQKTD